MRVIKKKSALHSGHARNKNSYDKRRTGRSEFSRLLPEGQPARPEARE